MLTNRQRYILAALFNRKDWCTGKTLAAELSISQKLLQQEIKALTAALGDHCDIQSNNRSGYKLCRLSQEVRNELFNSWTRHPDHHTVRQRTNMIYLYLLMQDDYITMGRLGEVFFLSKTAVFAEMNTLRRWVERRRGARLVISNRNGILLEASEEERRKILAQHARPSVIQEAPIEPQLKEQHMAIMQALRPYLRASFAREFPYLAGEEYLTIVQYCAVAIIRNLQGRTIPPNPDGTVTLFVEDLTQYFAEEFGCSFSLGEKQALTRYLAISGTLWVQTPRKLPIEKVLDHFEDFVKRELGLPTTAILFKDRSFLVNHLVNMKQRIAEDRIIFNYYSSSFAAHYPLETHLVGYYMPRLLGMAIPKYELTFLIPYVANALERHLSKMRVLLVSNQPLSYINHIRYNLERHWGESLGDIVSEPQYVFLTHDRTADQYDLLLTTEPDIIIAYPEFHLLPVMLDQDTLRQLFPAREPCESEFAESNELPYRFLRERSSQEITSWKDLLPISDSAARSAITVFNGLYVCEVDSELQEPMLCVWDMEKTFTYAQKQICTIVYAALPSLTDPAAKQFFRHARKILEELKS